MAAPPPLPGAQLLAQGAEGRLFAAEFLGRPVVVKERFRKDYRHPALDERLTRERLAWEARCLVRARRCGVDAPLLLFVDGVSHRLFMERVPGLTVKAYLHALQRRRGELAGGAAGSPAAALAEHDGEAAHRTARSRRPTAPPATVAAAATPPQPDDSLAPRHRHPRRAPGLQPRPSSWRPPWALGSRGCTSWRA